MLILFTILIALAYFISIVFYFSSLTIKYAVIILSSPFIFSIIIIIGHIGISVFINRNYFIKFLKLLLISLLSTIIISTGFIIEPYLQNIFLVKAVTEFFFEQLLLKYLTIYFLVFCSILILPSTLLILLIYKTENIYERIIRSSIYIFICLLVIDLTIYISVSEQFSFTVIIFSFISNFIGSIIAGILVSIISYLISEEIYETKLLKITFYKKLSLIIISLFILLLICFTIFFYHYPHNFRLTLSNWKMLSFKYSAENVKFDKNNDMINISINTTRVLTNIPAKKFILKFENKFKDETNKSKFSFTLKDVSNKIKFNENYLGGDVIIYGLYLYMLINNNRLDELFDIKLSIPVDTKILFIKRKNDELDDNEPNTSNNGDNSEKVTISFDMHTSITPSSEGFLKALMEKKHKGFEMEILNWKNINFCFLRDNKYKILKLPINIIMPDNNSFKFIGSNKYNLNIVNLNPGNQINIENYYGGYTFSTKNY